MADIEKIGKPADKAKRPGNLKKGSKPHASGTPQSSGGSRQGNVGHEGKTYTDNTHR